MGSSGAARVYTAAVMGGLLSSSCCMVQLALNVFSIGCAGFSVLTPYRPLFIGLTTASLGYTHLKHRNPRQSLLAVSIALALGAMPDVVQLYNEGRLFKLPADLGGLAAPRRSPAGSDQEENLQLQVEGLQCAACGMRLKQALRGKVSGLDSCEVDFESGRALIRGKGIDTAALIETISQMGYSAEVIAFQDELPGKEL